MKTMNDSPWHVLPVNDLREHEESERCWCRPELDYVGVGTIIIHNSADGRESHERGRKKH